MATNPYLARAQGLQDKTFEVQRQKQADALKLQTAPLSQALAADQMRLATYSDPQGNPLPQYKDQHKEVMDRMTQTIGKLREIYGQKAPGQDPSLLDKLHITNHLKSHTPEGRAAALKAYADQNRSTAQAAATGALPYEQTPQGQAGAEKHKATMEEIQARENGKPLAAPKGLKAMEQGGVYMGMIRDQDTGKMYTKDQLAPDGDAPPEAKQMNDSILKAKADKDAALKQRRDDAMKIAEERIRMARARLSSAGGAKAAKPSSAQNKLEGEYREAVSMKSLAQDAIDNPRNAEMQISLIHNLLHSSLGRVNEIEIKRMMTRGGLGLTPERWEATASTGGIPQELVRQIYDFTVSLEKSKLAGMNAPMPEGRTTQTQSKGTVSIAEAMKKPKYSKMTKEQVSNAITTAGYTPVD